MGNCCLFSQFPWRRAESIDSIEAFYCDGRKAGGYLQVGGEFRGSTTIIAHLPQGVCVRTCVCARTYVCAYVSVFTCNERLRGE